MIDHGTDPEPWYSKRGVLNVLNIACIDFNLLIVLVIEHLSACFEFLNVLILRSLLSVEELLALHVDFLVEGVVLELEFTV